MSLGTCVDKDGTILTQDEQPTTSSVRHDHYIFKKGIEIPDSDNVHDSQQVDFLGVINTGAISLQTVDQRPQLGHRTSFTVRCHVSSN